MTKKFTSTVAGASILITVVGLLSKGLGLIREVVFAGSFGLSANYDLYLIGAVLPITINTIILYIGQNYFIPNYNHFKAESNYEAEKFTNSTFWLFSFIGLILALILFFFSKAFIELYLKDFSSSELNSTINVFRIFLITIPLNAAFSILSAYLQSEYEFKFPAYSQLFLNISIILIVLFLSDSSGVLSIPIGYVIGTFLQLVYLVNKTIKRININFFISFQEKKIFSHLTTTFIFTILIEVISQLYLLIDRYFYHAVDTGGIAALNYSMFIFLMPVSIISAALSTALYPKISQLLNSKNNEGLINSVNSFFSINFFIFVPLTFIFYFFGDVIIRLFFQRGKFQYSDTLMTFSTLKYYSLSLLFYSSYIILNKILYSAKMVKALLIITIIGCLIKILLNFILVPVLVQDGLALSTTISYFFFFLSSFLLVSYKMNIKSGNNFLKEFTLNGINGLFSYSIVVILIDPTFFNSQIQFEIVQVVLFILIYSLNNIIIKHKAINFFYSTYENYFPKSRRKV